jgi:hypothetical protein
MPVRIPLMSRPRRPFVYDFTTRDELSSDITWTRGAVGQVFGSTLALEQKAVNIPRFEYDLDTGLSRGLLVEVTKTNSLRNNTWAGAVAGTPGTSPNLQSWDTSENSLTRQIVGVGQEDGIDYIDVRLSGTPSASSSFIIVLQDSSNAAAAAGQTWSGSTFLRLVAGSLTNLSLNHFMSARDNVGVFVDGVSAPRVPTSAALKTQRYSLTDTLVGGTIVGIDMDLRLGYTNALAIDVTLRIGLPQLEQADAPSTPIKTSTAAATRNGDLGTLVNPLVFRPEIYGTWVVRARTPAAPPSVATIGYLTMTDGTGTLDNYLALNYTTLGRIAMTSIVDSATVVNSSIDSGAIGPNVDFIAAIRWEANNTAGCVNGSPVVVDTATRLPIAPLTLAWLRGISTLRQPNAPIKSITFLPYRATNADLQRLTT